MGAFYFASGLLVAVTASIIGAVRRDPRYLYLAALIVTVFLSGLTGQRFIVTYGGPTSFFSGFGRWVFHGAGILIGISIFATARAGKLRWSAAIVMAVAAAWVIHLIVVILRIIEGASAPS